MLIVGYLLGTQPGNQKCSYTNYNIDTEQKMFLPQKMSANYTQIPYISFNTGIIE